MYFEAGCIELEKTWEWWEKTWFSEQSLVITVQLPLGHVGGVGGLVFLSVTSRILLEKHAPALQPRLRERPRTTASISYLDRWADCPTFHHRDITKPSCTGRGNGFWILPDTWRSAYLRVCRSCYESQHLQFEGCGKLQSCKKDTLSLEFRTVVVRGFTKSSYFQAWPRPTQLSDKWHLVSHEGQVPVTSGRTCDTEK